jgi:hypothetical protein
MDDHPFNDLPMRLPNFAASNRYNYLCSAYKRSNVVTAFVVRDYSNVSKQVTTILGRVVLGRRGIIASSAGLIPPTAASSLGPQSTRRETFTAVKRLPTMVPI